MRVRRARSNGEIRVHSAAFSHGTPLAPWLVVARLTCAATEARFDVVWFFERGDQCLQWEIRQVGDRYELVTEHPDRTRTVQTVDTPAELLQQVTAVPHAWFADGWRAKYA